jgi:hypothetical protein
MTSVPTTWPELRDRLRARNDEEARLIGPSTVQLINNRVAQTPVGRGLLGLDEILTRLAIVAGPASCRPILADLAPFYAAALEDATRAGSPGASPLIQLTLLSYGNLTRCIGDSPLPPATEQAMAELAFRGKKVLNEFDQQALAAACLAIGLPARALKLLDHDEPPPFKPGQKFDANVAGLLDYLYAAMKVGAAEKDVQPAWLAMHATFPWNLSAKVIKWSTLMWVARVVFGRIAGRPDAEIAGAVHALSSRS